jgi:hypothetical protein
MVVRAVRFPDYSYLFFVLVLVSSLNLRQVHLSGSLHASGIFLTNQTPLSISFQYNH